MTTRTLRSWGKTIVALVMIAGCGHHGTIAGPVDGGPAMADPRTGEVDAGFAFPDSGIGTSELLINRVDPQHGPYTGGAEAIVRGTGFTADALAWVGGSRVQPADTQWIDNNRLRIVVPAGVPGPAEVKVEVGDLSASLADGYIYDALVVSPNQGSMSGGTVIDIAGVADSNFAEGDTVEVGSASCTDVQIVSATRITCRTPAHAVATVDVVVHRMTDGSDVSAFDAFSYFDSSDPSAGGLGGGPVTGTVNLTVINAGSGAPITEAYAIVGENMDTPYQGLTNVLGQITFSGADLIGPQTLHVAKWCFENTSVVAFDATDVTVFLIPWMDPRCGEGGAPAGGRGRSGSHVSGELVFRGPNENGPNPWVDIPTPRTNESKVAYVYATQPCPGDANGCVNPDPSSGASRQRVTEIDVGIRGYLYSLFVRPAGLAVYALAGLENSVTGQFVPYVMGVGRNVLVGPGATAADVNIDMDIPLDHQVSVRLAGVPQPSSSGPDRFVLGADIDLGGEGIIVRRDLNGDRMDVVEERSSSSAFRFWAQPALLGTLSDGRYRIDAQWQTGDYGSSPTSTVIRTGILDVAAEVTVDGFVGIPQAVSPASGDTLPADRVLRWELTPGGVEPDLQIVLLQGGDGNPAWRHIVPGNVFEAPIPDFSTIPGVEDVAGGFVTWAVYAITIPGFDFDEFTYSYLNDRYWNAYALNQFTAQF